MRRILRNNYEALLVISLFAIFGILKLVLANKIAMLNLYFIPVLISGYYLGKKRAVLSAIASVLLAVLFMVRWPSEIIDGNNELNAGLNVLVWASLLILSSILISTLNERRQQKQTTGTFFLLDKYLKDSTARKNHPSRVSVMARKVSEELRLHPRLVEGIEAAGLLHDIADTKEGREILMDCCKFGKDSDPIFDIALPILLNRDSTLTMDNTSIGADIIDVVDHYDRLSCASSDQEPWQLIREMESTASKSEQRIITALSKTLHKQTA